LRGVTLKKEGKRNRKTGGRPSVPQAKKVRKTGRPLPAEMLKRGGKRKSRVPKRQKSTTLEKV